MQSIKYTAEIVLISVLLYWGSFDEQEAHGPHLLTWVTSYRSLSMHFSLLVSMFLPIYPFDCHGNQSNSAFWTTCIYSVEDYSSNISTKLFSTYLQWFRNKGHLSFFPQSGGSSLSSSSTSSAWAALAVLPRKKWIVSGHHHSRNGRSLSRLALIR